jgi:3-dehydroquinate synthase
MNSQELIFTNHVAESIDKIVDSLNPSNIFVLVDVNTSSFVLPRLQAQSKAIANATVITTKAGDINKNLEALASIWKQLGLQHATRDSLLINVGGGVITDMGAFAAATFKRGIRFVNVPTTLLGAVDASVGGKTGINFNNLKNQIGVFRNAEVVIISTTFFNTLNSEELRSGYGEMLKHALLSSQKAFDSLLTHPVDQIDPDRMLSLLEESVMVKKHIVDEDPEEKGLRRALNLGHTAGHAFESLALDRLSPIPHGYAVVYGLLTEMILSHMILKFPSDQLQRFASYVKDVYGPFDFTCDDYPKLLAYMSQDKKNHKAGEINFTLIEKPGKVKIDCVVSPDDIRNALDITRDLLGL